LNLAKLQGLLKSEVFQLILALAIGKAIVFLAIVPFAPPSSVVQGLGTKWDSNYYEVIATTGYNSTTAPYVFSPVYPFLIKAVYSLVGNTWASALFVTNLLSFVFPILVRRTFGYRTALFAEVFPTYLVFTTIAYSDVIALVLLAASFLLLTRNRIIRSSFAVSGAILTFYNLAWTFPSFLIALLHERRARRLVFYAVPLMTGAGILLWFKFETGDYFSLYRLEAPWQGSFANPLAQVMYLLCPSGKGSFTCQPWQAVGVSLPPPYWAIRNLLVEGFYIYGAFLLLKTPTKYRVFFFAYCLSVIFPLLFVIGLPALSIPRLLLPAFPIFIAYESLLRRRSDTLAYVAMSLALAAPISIIQYFAFFA
jgi:hypothetical protein